MSTAIEWTDETWNPVVGCDQVSPGCAHCYAKTLHDRRNLAWSRGKLVHEQYRQPFEVVQLKPDRLTTPLSWQRPRMVFVNSVSDLFHDSVPDEFIDRVFAVMALTPQHTYQILTKRAERMREYMSVDRAVILDRLDAASDDWTHGTVGELWPLPNVWLGVSVENQRFADERIPQLLQTPAAVRFVSAEPLLGPVNLYGWLRPIATPGSCIDIDGAWWHQPGSCDGCKPCLDWVIVGGESGPDARPFDLAWARSIVAQCQAAGVACFVKQIGAKPTCDHCGDYVAVFGPKDRKGGDPSEWPSDLRVREFPAQAR